MTPRRRLALQLTLLPHALGAGATRLQSTRVATLYAPLRRHRELFNPALVGTWFDSSFAELLEEASSGSADLSPHLTVEARDLYSFPLLTPAACDRIVSEVAHFGSTGLEARRPNSSKSRLGP